MDNQCSYCNKGINSLLEIDINRKYKITLTLVSPKNTLDVLSIRNGFLDLMLMVMKYLLDFVLSVEENYKK